MKDLYTKNYETLMKKIEDDTKKWKDILCSWVEKLILLKCPYYPKKSTDLINPYQNIKGIFHRTRTNNPKYWWNHQRSWIVSEIRSVKGTWCNVAGLKTEALWKKEYGQPLGEESGPWQQGNEDLSPITTRNWIFPINYINLEVDSSPEPPDKSPAQLTPGF